MKFLAPTALLFANMKFGFLPDVTLIFLLAVVMALDFLTGIWKAKMNNVVRTSNGFRQTVNKVISYSVAIICSGALSFIAEKKGSDGTIWLSGMLNDGFLIFIIYIEITSIFENLYAADSESKISKYFYAPALKILTFQLKNNPVIKQANAIDGGEISKP